MRVAHNYFIVQIVRYDRRQLSKRGLSNNFVLIDSMNADVHMIKFIFRID